MDSSKHGSGDRELIAPNGNKRLVRRDSKGRFSESDDLGRSLSRDVRQHATIEVQPGQGDQGDRKSPAKRSH
jgi:hypothetical protein